MQFKFQVRLVRKKNTADYVLLLSSKNSWLIIFKLKYFLAIMDN